MVFDGGNKYLLLVWRPSGSRLSREVTMNALFITITGLVLLAGGAFTSQCSFEDGSKGIMIACNGDCTPSSICLWRGNGCEPDPQFSVSCAGQNNDCVNDNGYCSYYTSFPTRPDSRTFTVKCCRKSYNISVTNGSITRCSSGGVGRSTTTGIPPSLNPDGTDGARNVSATATTITSGTQLRPNSDGRDSTPSTSIPTEHSYGLYFGIPIALAAVIAVAVASILLWRTYTYCHQRNSIDVPAADVPAADVPAADVPAADVPAADVPAADVPAADVHATDVPAVDVPAGNSTDVPVTENEIGNNNAKRRNGSLPKIVAHRRVELSDDIAATRNEQGGDQNFNDKTVEGGNMESKMIKQSPIQASTTEPAEYRCYAVGDKITSYPPPDGNVLYREVAFSRMIPHEIDIKDKDRTIIIM